MNTVVSLWRWCLPGTTIVAKVRYGTGTVLLVAIGSMEKPDAKARCDEMRQNYDTFVENNFQLDELDDGSDVNVSSSNAGLENNDEYNSGDDILEISIDQAVNRIGTGKFQSQILFAAGTCFMADSTEIILLSFLSLVLKKEWNWTDGDTVADAKAPTLTACMFIGALVGAAIIGRLGDRFGRKPVLLWTAFLISLFGLLTAFCNNFISLLIVRTIVGFGIGGLTIPFDILAEFTPDEQRGKYLYLIEYYWTAGSILVPIVAYFTLELAHSWRIFVAVCALPCVISLLVGVAFVPESPRWLVLQGKNEEALDILRKAAALNGKDPEIVFPQNCILGGEEQRSLGRQSEGEKGCGDLFSKRWRNTTLLLFIVWIGEALCYYGAVMLSTRVFDTNLNIHDQTAMFDYSAIFISSLSEALAITLAIALVNHVGRVKLLVTSYVCGGISLSILCLVVHTASRSTLIILAFIMRACEMFESSSVWVITVEIFSTDIRSTGHGATNAMARFGGFLSPYVVASYWSYRQIGITMLLFHLFIAFCASQLPETKGVQLGKVLKSDSDDNISVDHREVHQIT